MSFGSVLEAGGTIAAGDIAKAQSKTEAAAIDLQATQREVDRKERLNRALASQVAGAGASGITLAGSPQQTIEADSRMEARATARDRAGAEISALAAKSRGKVARKAARFSALTQLASDAEKTATMFAGGG